MLGAEACVRKKGDRLDVWVGDVYDAEVWGKELVFSPQKKELSVEHVIDKDANYEVEETEEKDDKRINKTENRMLLI